MQYRARDINEWQHTIALTNGQTLVVAWGSPGSGVTAVDCRSTPRFSFGVISSHACTFEILGAFDVNFTATDQLVSLGVVANTYTTTYQLPGPLNMNGVYVLTRPYITLRLLDAAATNHTYTRLYARAES